MSMAYIKVFQYWWEYKKYVSSLMFFFHLLKAQYSYVDSTLGQGLISYG